MSIEKKDKNEIKKKWEEPTITTKKEDDVLGECSNSVKALASSQVNIVNPTITCQS